MELKGTELQSATGIGLANYVLSNEIIADAVRRGQMHMTEAAALFASASQSLLKAAALWEGDPVSFQIAEAALEQGRQMVLAYSADEPPAGAH